MSHKSRWIAGAAAVAIAGLVYAFPVSAADTWTAMMGRGHTMMSGMMTGEMATMHNLMSPLMSEMPAMHAETMGEVARLFNMSADELAQAMSEGKTLAQLAEEKQVAVSDVQAVMTRGMGSFLDRLVSQEKITQAQATQMLGLMERNLSGCLSGQGPMGGMMQTMLKSN